jgi:hypothetical protein
LVLALFLLGIIAVIDEIGFGPVEPVPDQPGVFPSDLIRALHLLEMHSDEINVQA